MLLVHFLHASLLAALAASDPYRRSSRYRLEELEQRDSDDDLPTLKLVHVLFRHGDRSPVRTFPGDLYTEQDWPQGFGQLSTTGMQQAFDLGIFLGETYIEDQPGFLDPDYDRTQVYVRSTSYDRTLMTAYSLLAALFPPGVERTWKEELPWQPIPVHTMPIDEDAEFTGWVDCPAYNKASSDYRQTAAIFPETVQQYKEVYDLVSQETGLPATWEGLEQVLDPIYCELVSNYTLPDWVTDDVLGQLLELRDIYAGGDMPPDFAYLQGGMLVGEMLKHMQNVSTGGNTITERLFLYSAHDNTIAAFLITLGVFNHQHPPYTGCVMVELWEQPSGEHTVLISYRNETDTEPYPLQLPGCDVYCPLDEFAQLMQSSVVDDYAKACGIADPDYPLPPSGTTIAVAILTGALLLVLLIGVILCCVKRNKQQDNHDYKPVPMEME